MKFFFIFFFLTVVKCFGQDISEINKSLELSDTLKFETEIRIYKDYSITDRIEVFRMYDEGKSNWTVSIYFYSKNLKQVTKIDEIKFPKENVGKLKPKDANLIWLHILMSDVEFLPNIKDINYKFKKDSIEFEDGEYGLVKKKVYVLDGENYVVFIRNRKIKNSFTFDNPTSYLKHYPTVDELISYNQLLSVIKKEFNLW
jgi:hypothetical protein